MKNKVLAILSGLGVGATIVSIGVAYGNYISYKKSETKVKRLESYYNIMQQWIKGKQHGTFEEKLLEYKGMNVAIYGMGVLGELLYKEVKNTNIVFKGFIDKNAEVLIEGIDNTPIMTIEEIEQCEIDVVIVTPIFAFSEIENDIRRICNSDIEVVSLDALLEEV